MEAEFWEALEKFVASKSIVIDRPKGFTHPRFPGVIYPLDYGYLKDTKSTDGAEIDLWLGSRRLKNIDGILVTIDLQKTDLEIKLLIGCSEDEMYEILNLQNSGQMRSIIVKRGDI
jgi:inorganic pyrophosphatase